MNRSLIKIFAALILTLAALQASAQVKIYTRKARLESFPTSTTKVVVGGGSFMDSVLREEVAVHWRVSPYEFCSQAEYEASKGSSDFYFLTLTQADGVAFLTLSKGGKEDESNDLRKPFEVVSVPIASLDDPTGRELLFMGAFLDIIQTFVEEAMIDDKVGYAGLKHYNGGSLRGKRIYLDSEEIENHYMAETRNALLGICIAPESVGLNTHCYKMLISADNHELFYFKKDRYKGPKDKFFKDTEIKQFDKRNGIIAR